MLPMVWTESLLPGLRFTGKTQTQMPALEKPFSTEKIHPSTGVLREIAECTRMYSPGHLSYQQ